MNNLKKYTGIKRIKYALFNSMAGLKVAFKNEAAFRQELILFAIMLIILYLMPFIFMIKMLLFFAGIMLLVIELLNSAIEAVVDIASPQYHILAKDAKDIASSAVLIMLIINIILWLMAVINTFYI